MNNYFGDLLADHQIKALKKLSNGKVLYGGVGTGKSRVAVAYYKENEAPKDVYVITTARKRDERDWIHEFYRFDVGPKEGPTPIPGGVKAGRQRRSDAARGAGAVGVPGRVDADDEFVCRHVQRPDEGHLQTCRRSGGDLDGVHAGVDGSSRRHTDDQGGPSPACRCVHHEDSGRLSVGGGDRGKEGGGPGRDSSAGLLHADNREVDADGRGHRVLSASAPGAYDACPECGVLRKPGLEEGDDSGTEGVLEKERRSDAVVPGAAGEREGVLGEGVLGEVLAEPARAGGTYPWVVTVDSWQNINKYAGVEGAFFIFDEQRLVGSGVWTKAFLRIARRNTWLLLSGTPGDTWMDYVPLFIANNFYRNRTEFKHEHVIYNTFSKFPKIDRYVNVGRLVRQRNLLLVEMPYERHTKRRRVETQLLYDKELLDQVLKKRWHVYQDRPLRDVGEMFLVARRVVNSDPSRLEMVCELWKRHPKLIVFYNFNYELASLRSLKEYYGISETATGTRTKPGESGSGPTTSTSTSIGGGSRVATSSNTDTPDVNARSLRDPRQLSRTTPGAMDSGGQTASSVHTSGLENPRWTKKNETGSSKSALNEAARLVGDPGRFANLTAAGRLTEAPATDATSGTTSIITKLLEAAFEKFVSRSTSSNGPSGSTTAGSTRPGQTSSGGKSSTGKVADSLSGSETVAIAEWNGHKHEPIPTTDRWLYLVQYTAGAEAWNCIETDAMIRYSHNYSWKVTEQSEGRIDRLNTPFDELWYYVFTSDSFIDREIERSLRNKETFNEAKYAAMFHS